MKNYRSYILSMLFISVVSVVHAQENYWIKPDSLFKSVQPTASLQLWSTYSMNEKAQFDPDGGLEPVEDRLTFMARRARIGFKGKPYKRLTYALSIQYDNLGKDKLSAARGSTNTGQLGVLDAYLTFKITNSEVVYVTAGYLQPQISRECITGDLNVDGFDKSPSQGYIRQHVDGKNYGRATGMNLGGIVKNGLVQFGYNAGLFSNNTTSSDTKNFPETTGQHWSPLLVGRFTVSLGDPDMNTYSINYDANNYYSQRKGITIGAYRTQQGSTDIFSSNQAMGIDVLFNYANLNVNGEWSWLDREVEGSEYRAETGHIQVGYNIIVSKRFFIEPVFTVVDYSGDNGGQFTGHDRIYDAGINWFLNKKNCKLALHYVKSEGDGDNSYTDGVTFQKGDFVGMALVLIM